MRRWGGRPTRGAPRPGGTSGGDLLDAAIPASAGGKRSRCWRGASGGERALVTARFRILHPEGKSGVNTDREKYEAVREAIVAALDAALLQMYDVRYQTSDTGGKQWRGPCSAPDDSLPCHATSAATSPSRSATRC